MSPNSKLFLRWAAVILLVAVLLGGLVGRAQAVEIVNTGNIPAGQTVDDDVLIGATDVTVDGTVNGTLMAFGQSVEVNGNVKSDVITAGQNIIIGEKAVIEGNLFVGGSNVIVRGKVDGSIFGGGVSVSLAPTANVTRNVYVGSYDFQANAGSTVARDVSVGSYQVILNGTTRNVNLAAAAIEINGAINGDARLRVANPGSTRGTSFEFVQQFPGSRFPAVQAIQPGLRIAEGAKITGKLTYTSESNQSSTIQAVPGGGIVYQTPVPNQTNTRQNQPSFNFPSYAFGSFWLWDLLRNLVTILILGALVLGLAPMLFQNTVAQLQQRSLASLAVGLLALVVAFFAVPVIVIALLMLGLAFGLVTLIDVSGIILGLGFGTFGLIAGVFVVAFGWAGKLLLSFIIGAWLLNRVNPQAQPNRFGALALGALIFALIAAIPIAGWLFTFLVDLAGLGALWYLWRTRRTAVAVA